MQNKDYHDSYIRELAALRLQLEQSHQTIAALNQEKADLEILLEATMEHAVVIEYELQKAEDELYRALAQERELNQRIENLATLEERHRIARDIHDSLGHLLVGLNVQTETALALWKDDPERAYKFLTKAKQMGSQALEATRQSVADMRADPLQGQMLEDAIASLTQEFYRTTGIKPTCEICLSSHLSHRVSIVLYRIVQEGLTNICKYANASAVTIQIQPTDTGLSLTLADNGNGFQVNANRSGFGLLGMRERITSLGGHLEINSQLGAGCYIRASLPLEIKNLFGSKPTNHYQMQKNTHR
ncbi:sensor histidine kinase [Anabaena azotica]|uniref:histidine kinase n=1 Tax=Anabaena azotica FACHB-119 TaxID=947527 RepID=A0ABR8D4R4_9NOST|nr:sensor histidine kinase [Anabaena azotica]MBD2502140.1 sensor histidine kinase [Anabaena azotica FACHB-119]